MGWVWVPCLLLSWGSQRVRATCTCIRVAQSATLKVVHCCVCSLLGRLRRKTTSRIAESGQCLIRCAIEVLLARLGHWRMPVQFLFLNADIYNALNDTVSAVLKWCGGERDMPLTLRKGGSSVNVQSCQLASGVAWLGSVLIKCWSYDSTLTLKEMGRLQGRLLFLCYTPVCQGWDIMGFRIPPSPWLLSLKQGGWASVLQWESGDLDVCTKARNNWQQREGLPKS